MNTKNKKPKTPQYWQSISEIHPHMDPHQPIQKPEEKPSQKSLTEHTLQKAIQNNQSDHPFSRRDFFKTLGFSISTMSIASACSKAPVRKALTYLYQPEEVVPGVANWYASTCSGCPSACSVLVKTREGRPIKIEGNPSSSLSQGGLCSVGHSVLLNLYDQNRLKSPMAFQKKIPWKNIDAQIKTKLNQIALKKNYKIVILTTTIPSPTTQQVFNDFIKKYPQTQIVTYDPISYFSIVKSHEMSFNKPVLPNYHLDQAQIIVSFAADFLGTWLSPVRFARDYSKNRKLKPPINMSRHIQFESILSLTGANADVRIPIKPSEQTLALLYLYYELNQKLTPIKLPQFQQYHSFKIQKIKKTAQELLFHREKAVVLCHSQDVNTQRIVNSINHTLFAYKKIIDLDNPSFQRQGNDFEINSLVQNIKQENVDALIFYHTNPAYNYPLFPKQKLKKIPLTISLNDRMDETTSLVQYACPDHHGLESWNDFEPVQSHYTMNQPTIHPIYDTRQAQESLLNWIDQPIEYYQYIKDHFKKTVFPKQKQFQSFKKFWNHSVQEGVFRLKPNPQKNHPFVDQIDFVQNLIDSSQNNHPIELILYETNSIRDGTHANNPWLQEIPDPITKVSWNNFASLSTKECQKMGLSQGDIIEIKLQNHQSIKMPVLPQTGQADGSLAIALGYGRTHAGPTGNLIGKNFFPWVPIKNQLFQYHRKKIQITKTHQKDYLALQQIYHFLTEPITGKYRHSIIQEKTLDEFKKWTQKPHEKSHLVDLWPERPETKDAPQKWGMIIDLTSCTGCASCVVSCQIENNIPVVGPKEMAKGRGMHWMRIDRYYSQDVSNPETIFQPMTCHHCDHAPCETVCPVLATTHSIDGLNQQTYNRCVGTRYCANNCPYKVRRFNWFEYNNNPNFDYYRNNDLGKLVLNPDVTVRSRGVMEKCSFCIQRIQAGRLQAKKDSVPLDDSHIKTACQQSCPTQSIVFGNLKNPKSQISQIYRDKRKYYALEELKVLPSLGYLTKIRNKNLQEKKEKLS